MNPDSELDHDALLRRLIAAVPCSVCNSAFDLHDVNVVSQEDEHEWMLVALCPNCGAESLIFLYVDVLDEHTDVSWVDELSGDTSDEEVGHFPHEEDAPDMSLPPLTEAEIIEWRQFLAAFDGDLRGLLQW